MEELLKSSRESTVKDSERTPSTRKRNEQSPEVKFLFSDLQNTEISNSQPKPKAPSDASTNNNGNS